MSIIIERFNKIKSNISKINKTKSIKIIAVSKTFHLDHMMPLINFGHNTMEKTKYKKLRLNGLNLKK